MRTHRLSPLLLCSLVAAASCDAPTTLTITVDGETVSRLVVSVYDRAGVLRDAREEAVQGRLIEGVSLPTRIRLTLTDRNERVRIAVRGDLDQQVRFGAAELDVKRGVANSVTVSLDDSTRDFDDVDVPDVVDNCFDVSNPDQRNSDSAGPGDLCLDGNPPALAGKITQFDFGSVVVGQSSGVAAIGFVNAGGQRTLALRAALTGIDATQFIVVADECSGKELLPGLSCNVTARFDPGIAGALRSTIEVESGDLRASVELQGTAVPPGTIVIEPAELALGERVFGDFADVGVTVRNVGNTPTSALDPFTIEGTGAALFSVVTDACNGVVLQPGGACTGSIRFTAAAPAGAQTASLVIAAAEGGIAVGALSGTSLAPAQLVASPAALSFPSVCASCLGCAVRSTIIRNDGGQRASAISYSIGNSFVATGCTGMSLLPGQSCRIDVRFRPQAQASYSQLLAVTAATGGTTAVTLSGIGAASCVCMACFGEDPTPIEDL